MKFSTLFARCAIASAALLAVAGANASTISITKQYSQATIAANNFGVANKGLQVPVWNLNDNGTDWLAFCIEPQTGMHTDLSAQYTSASFSGFDSNASIQRLYGTSYASTLGTGATASLNALGFQLALWELYNDNGSLASGNLSLIAGGGNTMLHADATIAKANEFLALANSTAAYTSQYTFTKYSAIGSQSVVTANLVSAVPEPSTYAMMGIGLAAMGLIARRRKQA